VKSRRDFAATRQLMRRCDGIFSANFVAALLAQQACRARARYDESGGDRPTSAESQAEA
jgi:hypothetical protein